MPIRLAQLKRTKFGKKLAKFISPKLFKKGQNGENLSNHKSTQACLYHSFILSTRNNQEYQFEQEEEG
jgi:hypothetical protein